MTSNVFPTVLLKILISNNSTEQSLKFVLGKSRGFIFLPIAEEISKVWRAVLDVNAFFSHHYYNILVT